MADGRDDGDVFEESKSVDVLATERCSVLVGLGGGRNFVEGEESTTWTQQKEILFQARARVAPATIKGCRVHFRSEAEPRPPSRSSLKVKQHEDHHSSCGLYGSPVPSFLPNITLLLILSHCDTVHRPRNITIEQMAPFLSPTHLQPRGRVSLASMRVKCMSLVFPILTGEGTGSDVRSLQFYHPMSTLRGNLITSPRYNSAYRFRLPPKAHLRRAKLFPIPKTHTSRYVCPRRQ